ncbi:hypothetical protein [Bacillus sp. AFS029533]|uniref:hypothetical protein n=1 Tax=Bacillus sp. AFS029533 TaxID=2033494 RepID=UPI000BFB4C83|nr:hypothetical protein [Bacillus sp. AFS029533]PGZ92192.1 hypothetical protein COE53_12575 [Bacillus sp. AFS029533]
MKKYVLAAVGISTVLMLSACGDKETTTKPKNKPKETSNVEKLLKGGTSIFPMENGNYMLFLKVGKPTDIKKSDVTSIEFKSKTDGVLDGGDTVDVYQKGNKYRIVVTEDNDSVKENEERERTYMVVAVDNDKYMIASVARAKEKEKPLEKSKVKKVNGGTISVGDYVRLDEVSGGYNVVITQDR